MHLNRLFWLKVIVRDSLLVSTTILNDNCDYQFSPWLACIREFIDLLSDSEEDFDTQEAIQASLSLQQDVGNHFCTKYVWNN